MLLPNVDRFLEFSDRLLTVRVLSSGLGELFREFELLLESSVQLLDFRDVVLFLHLKVHGLVVHFFVQPRDVLLKHSIFMLCLVYLLA